MPDKNKIILGTNDDTYIAADDAGNIVLQHEGGNRVSLTNDSILPADDEQIDLGSADKKFRDLYLSSDSIYIGNTKLSSDPTTGALSTVVADENGAFTAPAEAVGGAPETVGKRVTETVTAGMTYNGRSFAPSLHGLFSGALNAEIAKQIINQDYPYRTLQVLFGAQNPFMANGLTLENSATFLGYAPLTPESNLSNYNGDYPGASNGALPPGKLFPMDHGELEIGTSDMDNDPTNTLGSSGGSELCWKGHGLKLEIVPYNDYLYTGPEQTSQQRVEYIVLPGHELSDEDEFGSGHVDNANLRWYAIGPVYETDPRYSEYGTGHPRWELRDKDTGEVKPFSDVMVPCKLLNYGLDPSIPNKYEYVSLEYITQEQANSGFQWDWTANSDEGQAVNAGTYPEGMLHPNNATWSVLGGGVTVNGDLKFSHKGEQYKMSPSWAREGQYRQHNIKAIKI